MAKKKSHRNRLATPLFDRSTFHADLARGLRQVVGDATHREVGERTGEHPENIRRWLRSGTANVNFVRAFCREYNVNADWLLVCKGQWERR